MGTKTDPMGLGSATGGGGFGIGPIVQTLLALGLVALLLKFALPKLAASLNKKLRSSGEAGIRIEESATFAGGTLYIVTARNRSLLLSVSTSGVACLADLTSGPLVEPATFGEMLAETAAPTSIPSQTDGDLLAALRRLDGLAVR